MGNSTSKIKKVVISGYIFAYVFEDVLGLSSPLKACHLIMPLSSIYSPVRTCQSPPRQLVMTEGFPRSSWCREPGHLWIPESTPLIQKQTPPERNSLKRPFIQCFPTHWLTVSLDFTMLPVLMVSECTPNCGFAGLPRSRALKGKKEKSNTADAYRHCQDWIGRKWKEIHVGESAMFFLQLFKRHASLGNALKTKLQSHTGTRGINLPDWKQITWIHIGRS